MEQGPNSILIVKLSAIGDVVQALPLLEVLRKNFPEARLDWVVEEDSFPIVEAHEGIDRVIVSRRKSWQKALFRDHAPREVLGEILRFIRALRAHEYDLVIDLQGLLKSAIITGLCRAKRKMGFNWGREGSRLFLTERPLPVEPEDHAVDKYLRVAEYLNCQRDSWRGHVPVLEADKRAVDRLLGERGIAEQRLVAFNPMAKWESKLWGSERFAALADRVRRELSCTIIFTGSRGDRSQVDEIIESMEERAVNLAGQTSLRELAHLYSRCQLLVTTDTGPMHIAAAMGCPVVALFGPTAPWRTGPYGEGHRVIRDDMGCSPCFKKRCVPLTCMDNISVEAVFGAVCEQLKTPS